MPDNVRKHGSIENYSAFPFENYLGPVSRLPKRKQKQILKEIVNNVNGKISVVIECTKYNPFRVVTNGEDSFKVSKI